MLLQAARTTVLAVSFALWFASLKAATEIAVNLPIAADQEPNLVLYCAMVIVATLGMFTLWAAVSWVFSVAPLLAMLGNLGAGASLVAAFRLGPLRSRLVEINLVMGIVKIALIVLAMVFPRVLCPSRAWPRRSSWPGGMPGVTVPLSGGIGFFPRRASDGVPGTLESCTTALPTDLLKFHRIFSS